MLVHKSHQRLHRAQLHAERNPPNAFMQIRLQGGVTISVKVSGDIWLHEMVEGEDDYDGLKDEEHGERNAIEELPDGLVGLPAEADGENAVSKDILEHDCG
jgi:hypothetical protein